MYYLDSYMIECFRRCPEEFRHRFIENLEPGHGEIHLIFGSAVHEAVELLWKGHTFQEALREAQLVMRDEEPTIHSLDRRKYEELQSILPDVIACYCDNALINPSLLLPGRILGSVMLEYQFAHKYSENVTIVGRIDRVEGKQ